MTNPNGRFGIYGGQYIPETLMNAVIELEEAYNHFKNDPERTSPVLFSYGDTGHLYGHEPGRPQIHYSTGKPY